MVAVVLATQIAAAWFMTGLIWLIQLVHYPLMAQVGPERFIEYHHAHSALITLIVGPVMLLEAAGAVYLWAVLGGQTHGWVWWLTGALLAVVWASTAFLQVPCHGLLAQGFDAAVHAKLVDTNWIRTVGWTLRALLLMGFWLWRSP